MILTQEQKLQILLGLFVGAIVAANLLGTKIANLWVAVASVGIFMYPITFLVTDVVEDVFGKEKVKGFVIAGFIAIILVMLLTVLSVMLPPASRYASNEAFLEVFSPSIRIMIASLIAFLLAQYHDIWAFNFWKKKTKGRFLWLRNNLSTVVSQFIDTTVFMFIAFYMATPKYTVDFIFAQIVPYYLLKVFVAFCDTPFVYLGVWWLKGERPKKK
ncbi:MAG: queuosine precursor transporter [Candidatus Aenigmatarchaeota archaeon]|nr:MAG: queuosine precursor transporter [Candidatus Aenigmarchaeota archaeon]